MPELPEVETVRRGLAPFMEGCFVEKLTLNRDDLRFPFPKHLKEHVEGRRVNSLSRRAKYLLIDLEDDQTLIVHLGMSGSFRIETGSKMTPGAFYHERSKNKTHDHVIFDLVGGNCPVRIIYNDPRRFGFMQLEKTSRLDSYPAFAGLGPEPTGNILSADYLASRFARRKQPLKTALLDQKIIAGLGNIYVCEAMHRAHLSPERTIGSLVDNGGKPLPELDYLVGEIRAVIAEAIEAGGSSLRDYIHTDGSLGYFQHSFRVYDQEGKPCQTPCCGGTIARLTQGGRSTFFCPECQN